MPEIQTNDYVIAKKKIDNIEKNSVGLVAEVLSDKITIFFIGKKKTIKTIRENISFLDITKTGKPHPVKICNICHILKDDIEFDVNQTDAKGRKTTRPSCKMCRVAIDGVRMLPSESRRMDNQKPKYLFTCPICKKTSIPDVTANLVKDHDHITGMGRAWICDSCNTGLGRFKDDISLIKEVIKYLESYT